jgi:hypothetical protein
MIIWKQKGFCSSWLYIINVLLVYSENLMDFAFFACSDVCWWIALLNILKTNKEKPRSRF